MKVLLTGSTGWLGRHLAPMLMKAGHEVVGIDIAPGPFTQVIGSVANRSVIDDTFAAHGIEAVIHAGGLHKPDIARFPAQAFIDTNVTGTLNLLEAAVASGHDRFVMTSTTSLMISQAIRDGDLQDAIWLDETTGPLAPRNIYGVTKLAAEGLCRQAALASPLNCIALRTSRFFPEDDDTHSDPPGDNLKANEFLHRRLTVRDAARAHVEALARAPDIGFGMYLVSAPTPFTPADCARLKRSAAELIADRFPDAAALYAERGWVLPASIGRVYDGSLISRELGFEYETDFVAILRALKSDAALPFAHDAGFISPSTLGREYLSC